MNQLVVRAKEQAAAGILPPRFAFETVIVQTKALKDGTPVFNDMKSKINALLTGDKITEEEATELIGKSEKAIMTIFKPAYADLLSWLESEVDNAEEKSPLGLVGMKMAKIFITIVLKYLPPPV
ncbi:DUF885 family protein [Winogradskyella maritima]|nr:DUF885 family protein [Winogradskyella maritima]